MENQSVQFENFSNSFADAVDTAAAYTVMVNARRRLPSTGIAYSSDLVLTANHAIERDDDVKIILHDGRSFTAAVAGRDPVRDIALLKLKEAVLSPASKAPNAPRIGQLVLALGRPDENGLQASLGVVSAIGGPVRTGQGGILEKYLRTDTMPLPGFSGGPLITAGGTVLGMNTSGMVMDTLITIPVEVLWPAAAALAEHGHIQRAYLGVRSQNVHLAEGQQEALGRKQDVALLLVGIEESSPASRSGLMVGDILTGIQGHAIEDHDELQIHLSSAGVGQLVAIEILRGGKLTTVQVTLAER
jgi:S1-C subfamily serine protease